MKSNSSTPSIALMLARPHICLRCQIHLARRFAPAGTSASARAFQTSRTSNFAAAPAPAPSDDAAPDSHDEHGDNGMGNEVRNNEGFSGSEITWNSDINATQLPARHKINDLVVFPPVPPKVQIQAKNVPISEFPLGKVYGYSGQMQRAGREHLNAQVLGEQAKVIVLRDTNIFNVTRLKEGTPREIKAQKAEAIDILATLDGQQGTVGQDEVIDNIDLLRPKKGEEPQSLEEFDVLVQQICSGFRKSQIQTYVQSFKQKHGSDALSMLEKESPFIQVTKWVPDTSVSTHHLDERSGRGYDFASYTNKQRLALLLLRKCWKLEVPELEEGIGEVELSLRPADYDLLIRMCQPSRCKCTH
jgi:hypothetical protein